MVAKPSKWDPLSQNLGNDKDIGKRTETQPLEEISVKREGKIFFLERPNTQKGVHHCEKKTKKLHEDNAQKQ